MTSKRKTSKKTTRRNALAQGIKDGLDARSEQPSAEEIATTVADQITVVMRLAADYANVLQSRGEATLAAMVRKEVETTRAMVGQYLNMQVGLANTDEEES